MNDHVSVIGKSSDVFEHFSRATESEPRGEATANSVVVLSMPLLNQIERLGNRGFCLLEQRGRHPVTVVHHALANRRSKTSLLDGSEHSICVPDRFHRERASGPA